MLPEFGCMNLLLPVVAFGAWYFMDKQSQGAALQKCEIQKFKLGKLSIGLQETTIPVVLDVFNPNNRTVYVDYFRGNVSRAGIKAADFTFNSDGKTIPLKSRASTPLTFNVRITTIGTVRNLVDIFKNLLAAKPIDTVFTIDGYLSISGFEVPIKFVWDAKKNTLVSSVNGIGKPYAKFEFGSNQEMDDFFRQEKIKQFNAKNNFSKN